MAAPRRLIWVSALAPDPAGTGGQLRQAHLLAAAAEHLPVHLVLAADQVPDAIVPLLTDVTLVAAPPPPVALPGTTRALMLANHLLRDRVPLPVAQAAPVRASLGAAAAAASGHGDTVVVEHLELAPLGRELSHAASRILTIHHSTARQAEDHVVIARTRRRRAYWRAQARRAARLEAAAGGWFDRVVAVSDLDATHIAAPTTVVPNGVVIPDRTPPPPGEDRLLFAAALDYEPNIDGITWFAETAWPRIRSARPGATLEVVGRRPVPAVRALTDLSGVRVTADVPDMAPHLAAADVAIVPLRLGGGTRLKALEAMAARRPLVGTTIGLEGLGLVDGEHARIADDPDALAAAVVDTLTDDAAAADRVERAHRRAREAYDWQVVGAGFVRDVLQA